MRWSLLAKKFFTRSAARPDLELSSRTFDGVKGMSWASSGELASPGLQPKKVSAKQVHYEELVNMEDRMEFTQREEIDIDFRVSGLPHAVVKQVENSRVRELVKKIESHPHRQDLQAYLQQSNAYNPFSEKSK